MHVHRFNFCGLSHALKKTHERKNCLSNITTCDEERVYLTATGIVWAFEASRSVADITAEAR